jgi:DNA-directed RNA polymerase specialized sigma24 family protein
MSNMGSVTLWIGQLKAGTRAAAQPLWQNYFQQLVTRARHTLAGAARRAADEEDVALSAFDSFYRAAEQGRFPDLKDRDDLWQLLVVITDRKACDAAKHERRARRGGGNVVTEGDLVGKGADDEGQAPLAAMPAQEPSADFALQAAEEYERLLNMLGDPDLRRVAVRKMEGYTVEEIAAELERVPRTVKRWLRMIRQTWEAELQP